MSQIAPLCIPVELRHVGCGERYFRLADAISTDGLHFAKQLPEELDGLVDVRLELPDDLGPLACQAQILVTAGGEEARRRYHALRFVALDERTVARITRYVDERLGTS